MKKTISILLLIALVISCVSVGYADNEFKQYSLIGRSAMPWTSDEIFSSPEYRAYLTLMSTYSIGISTDMDNMMYIMDNLEFYFKDNQRAYNQFWNRYDRPPKAIYQRYILERRDLLVPQDIREVKGSYYTPEQWVRLSQEYLAKVLGEDWQEEYYVWDCAAGSGNLLRGLTNKYNIYASTLDDSDVKAGKSE